MRSRSRCCARTVWQQSVALQLAPLDPARERDGERHHGRMEEEQATEAHREDGARMTHWLARISAVVK